MLCTNATVGRYYTMSSNYISLFTALSWLHGRLKDRQRYATFQKYIIVNCSTYFVASRKNVHVFSQPGHQFVNTTPMAPNENYPAPLNIRPSFQLVTIVVTSAHTNTIAREEHYLRYSTV